MKTIERLRWRAAALINKLPGQCWADIADWPLGYKRNPWSPQRPGCREDLARVGSCYCGKLRTPASRLPTHVGVAPCPTCWVEPRQTHELSCPQVSPSQAWAYLDEVHAERERCDRRDRRMALAGRWIAGVVVLLTAALVWGWTR